MNNYFSNFPSTRLRRLRKFSWSRKLIQENTLTVSDLILPIFITYSKNSSDIVAMPGIRRYCLDDFINLVSSAYRVGIRAIALFPEVPKEKKIFKEVKHIIKIILFARQSGK